MPNYQHDNRRLEREQSEFWAGRVRVQNEAQELRCKLARAQHDERQRILVKLAVLKKEHPQYKNGIEAAMTAIKALERG
jgi:hypothetical protein